MCVGRGECAHVVPLEKRKQWWSDRLLWALQSGSWELNSRALFFIVNLAKTRHNGKRQPQLKNHLHYMACGHTHGGVFLIANCCKRASLLGTVQSLGSRKPWTLQICLGSQLERYSIMVGKLGWCSWWLSCGRSSSHGIGTGGRGKQVLVLLSSVISSFLFYATLLCSLQVMLPIQGGSSLPS